MLGGGKSWEGKQWASGGVGSDREMPWIMVGAHEEGPETVEAQACHWWGAEVGCQGSCVEESEARNGAWLVGRHLGLCWGRSEPQ